MSQQTTDKENNKEVQVIAMEENNYKADITELKARMTNAEKNIDRHENLINELDDKSADNRSEIATLNITIAKLNGNIDLMRQDIVSSNKELSNTNKELSMKIENLFERVNNTIEKSEIKRNDLEEKEDKIRYVFDYFISSNDTKNKTD